MFAFNISCIAVMQKYFAKILIFHQFYWNILLGSVFEAEEQVREILLNLENIWQI